MSNDKVMYLCPRCDRPYFQISMTEWNKDEKKYQELAKKAKRSHLCPWMRSKKAKSE